MDASGKISGNIMERTRHEKDSYAELIPQRLCAPGKPAGALFWPTMLDRVAFVMMLSPSV
jgi:hypothetical protein